MCDHGPVRCCCVASFSTPPGSSGPASLELEMAQMRRMGVVEVVPRSAVHGDKVVRCCWVDDERFGEEARGRLRAPSGPARRGGRIAPVRHRVQDPRQGRAAAAGRPGGRSRRSRARSDGVAPKFEDTEDALRAMAVDSDSLKPAGTPGTNVTGCGQRDVAK